MLNLSQQFLSVLVLVAASTTVRAFAAPNDSQLVRMVPAGAEIVSGIADPGTPGATGRILVATESNNRDFNDCLALLGIDGDKTIEEVVESASSSVAGDVSNHLLLLRGRFDHARIFKAAIENRATRRDYNGLSLLVIPPFQRERQQINQVRWLAILNDRILVFGVPGTVANALDRYAHNEQTDPILARRLAQFRTDVNCWSVIAMPFPMLESHLALYLLSESWKATLRDVDELAVGIHYGYYDRVDFTVHVDGSDGSVGRLMAEGQLIRASVTSAREFQVESLPTNENRLRGSFKVRATEFDRWLASVE